MASRLRYADPVEVSMLPERLQAAARQAAAGVAEGHTSGLVILVARRGMIVLHEAFGTLTPEPSAPPLPRDAIFPLASITKPITATAVMCLVDDGLLGLNWPVQRYIPEFVGEGKEGVTVHHLLTHTAGQWDEDILAHSARKRAAAEIPPPAADQHPGVAERLFLGYDAPLRKPPGIEMAYSSYGYELLGEIVRRVSGRPFAAFVEERVFQPLGMRDTYLIVPEAARGRIARRRPPGAPVAAGAYASEFETRDYEERPTASGGAYSTALDMATFGQMFLQRGRYGDARVLSPAAVAAMTRNQIPGVELRQGDEFYPEASWGLGWNISGGKRQPRGATLSSAQTYEHNGRGGTYLGVDPINDLVVVYFSLLTHGIPGFLPDWRGDLLINAVTAAIED